MSLKGRQRGASSTTPPATHSSYNVSGRVKYRQSPCALCQPLQSIRPFYCFNISFKSPPAEDIQQHSHDPFGRGVSSIHTPMFPIKRCIKPLTVFIGVRRLMRLGVWEAQAICAQKKRYLIDSQQCGSLGETLLSQRLPFLFFLFFKGLHYRTPGYYS